MPNDPADVESVLKRIRAQAAAGMYRVSEHAGQEMADEDITQNDVLEAIAGSEVLENYPEHRRGACCLLSGTTNSGRPLHIVRSTTRPELVIITVYEPKPPTWPTPRQRRQSR